MAKLYVNNTVVEEHYPFTPKEATEAFVAEIYGDDATWEVRLTNKELENQFEDWVYKQYPLPKQSQDEHWATYYRTMLSAAGADKLEQAVVGIAQADDRDEAIQVWVSNLPDALLTKIGAGSKAKNKTKATEMMSKLVKVALRMNWLSVVVDEFKAGAIEYTPFPTFTE
jgi:hypothetical protein